jgi:invasion protein IalB
LADKDLNNRNILIALAIVVVALIAIVAYYAGTRTTTLAVGPGGMRQGGPGQSQIVRLPPQHFGNWTLSCIRGPRGGQRCSLSLAVVDPSHKFLLLRLGVVRSKKGPVMIAITPPTAMLPAGFSILPEKGHVVSVPFTRCLPRACQAVLPLTDELISALTAAASAQIHFVAGSGRPVNFKIGVQGFAEGYSNWQTHDMPPPGATAPTPPAAPQPAPTPAPAPKPAQPTSDTTPNLSDGN